MIMIQICFIQLTEIPDIKLKKPKINAVSSTASFFNNQYGYEI